MTIALGHQAASTADVLVLARMNQQLIEDERHRNPMNLAELETRMRSMLDGGTMATMFESRGRVIAYALCREEPEWV